MLSRTRFAFCPVRPLACALAAQALLHSLLLAGAAEEPFSRPLRPRAGSDPSAAPRFVRLAPEATGVDFLHPVDLQHPLKRLYIAGYAAGGIAIGDIDGDGTPDLFFAGAPGPNRLFLQERDAGGNPAFQFRDATAEAGVDGSGAWSAGAALADIDGDGDLDLYICNYDSPNHLFINETREAGKPRFAERAAQFGLDWVDASFMPHFCDYDRDGDLDVFVLGYQYRDPDGQPVEPLVEERNGRTVVQAAYEKYYGIVPDITGKPTFTNIGRPDLLLRSNAANRTAPDEPVRFDNVTRAAGLADIGAGNSALWWDFNEDGYPDLYVANDFKVADQLFRNNGDGTFTDVIRESVMHTTWFSMGSDAGDVNNDGRIDLLVSDMAGTTHYRSKVTMGEMSVHAPFLKRAEPRQFMRNALFLNTGSTRFLEAAYLAGIAHSDWTWAARLLDLDNDGRLDVFFTNGAARMFNHSDRNIRKAEWAGKTEWDMWEDTEPRREENLAFRNLGDLKFQPAGAEWGLDHLGMSYACASADLDLDGDLDLVTADLDEPVGIYRNQTADGGGLRVELRGRGFNRFGLGAVARVETAAGTQVRQMMPMTGFLSCNEPALHFGTGSEETVRRLTVDWPGGIRQEFSGLRTGRAYVITEPETGSPRPEPDALRPLFSPSPAVPALRHQEVEFDDFARQPLLPFQHSQLGPGLAVGDIDGDGDDDVYLGRAKGSPRAVYRNDGRGALSVPSATAFEADRDREDLGALFFDADRDGDADLYVVSGSVECEPGAGELEDRLYLNDGKGAFQRAPAGTLPAARESGSVVCAADYDRDGDLDLFVGGRVIPGRYPETPRSLLLENQSAPGTPRFVLAGDEAAPELAGAGLVTAALWSDADGDGWVDLLVACEWGPVRWFRNEAGPEGRRTLTERTAESGLDRLLGWWNGLAGRDLDNDGDVDYVVTNFGLNTAYKATPEHPELLYYGDFDGTGKRHLVEAKLEGQTWYPRRGLSCSSSAMPFVRQKLPTFHDFGLSSLQEVYSEERLQSALRFEATVLESGILLNGGDAPADGGPRFRFVPLPRLAQISPSFGIGLLDFDADGLTDLFLAQNFFSPQLETGRMDSGLSLLLRGLGGNGRDAIAYEPVWPRESGISIPADAKAVAVTDFTEDGRPDLLVSVNNGTMQALEAVRRDDRRVFRVRLRGPAGNPTGAGALVTLRFPDGGSSVQTAEVQAGSGYLGQSTADLFFGCGSAQPERLEVRWPDGKRASYRIPEGAGGLVAAPPAAVQR